VHHGTGGGVQVGTGQVPAHVAVAVAAVQPAPEPAVVQGTM